MDRAEVGDCSTTSLQCGVEVGSQAMLVQNVSDVVRTSWHDVGSRARRYIVIFMIGRSSASGGWLFQALWSSRKGNPASRQTRSHGFVNNGLTPVDAVDAVVVVSRAPWASERLRSARQGLLY